MAMSNPQAIQVHCDGAMDYDSKQTGGNGFVIEFPDNIGQEPIERAYRNDKQGIHRLELISIIEAMEELVRREKKIPGLLRKAAGVEIYTDRLSATDSELTNPYRIRDWRRDGWKTKEGKPVKDKDLLDRIDKLRVKLIKLVGGGVSISYKREKRNKVADRLSKVGKNSSLSKKSTISKKNRRVIRRLYSGGRIKLSLLKTGMSIEGRVYAWERVSAEYEICFEICGGAFEGLVLVAYVDDKQKSGLHRGHRYSLEVGDVYREHVRIKRFEEISS